MGRGRVPVRPRPAASGEQGRAGGAQKLRGDRIAAECLSFRRKPRRFAADVRDGLAAADPPTPEVLGARQCDVWRPPLAVADAAGGGWPARAASAAVAAWAATGGETDYGLLLLEDPRGLFDTRGTDAPFSAVIVEELAKKEGRPRPEYRGDRPITENGLASLLRRFEVRPPTVRVGDDPAKGYRREDLAPLFKLYLPTPEPTVTTVTPPGNQGGNPCDGRVTGSDPPGTDRPGVTDGVTPVTPAENPDRHGGKPANPGGVTVVTVHPDMAGVRAAAVDVERRARHLARRSPA